MDWNLNGNSFVLDIEIPVNTTTAVILPNGVVQMNGKSAASSRTEKSENTLELGSGKYSFLVQ